MALVPYLAVGLLEVFAVVSPSSTTESTLVLPLALQEMVLAVWLIVRGFSCPADSSSPNGEARAAPYPLLGDEFALDSA